ncbi:MAG: glycosyltransferase family 61 protein [Oscillatoriales cyanobacterium SM2_3_0]|nr:glycosyltransferase family 61 protein [Oscillatoriales cyanobacterium SM2_3_0]
MPQNWQTSLAIESSISLTRIYPEDHANLSPAKTLSSQEHPLFQVQAVQSFAPSVAVIPQGRVWADALNIAVLNVNNQIISELSQGCGEIIFSIEKRARPQSISGRIALLSVQFGLVYYHWILDVLPRFHLLSQLGYLFNTIDGFVVNQYDYPYEKESLELLGIPQNKIIESRTLSAIQTTELIVPFWPSQPSIKPPIWAIKFLRDTFLPYALAGSSFRSDCLYISRKNASCRRLTNESEVINLLQKYHFKAVQLEQFSLREQIAILQQARTVVSAHGSGLTNIVFCNPGTKIVEILSPIWINSCYWHLSSLSGLDYYYLLGEVDEESVSTSVNRQDFRVDLSALAQVLQLAQIS